MKKRWWWIGGAILGLVLAVTGVMAYGQFGKDLARAELVLSNLTCGSCVSKVQAALSGLPGVGTVEVSVTSGRARVDFEPATLSAEKIAERITAAGYPARVAEVLSPAEVQALRDDTARLADKFVGRVGDRLVSRADFTAEVDRLRAKVPAGQAVPEGRLQQAAWQEKVQRELVLADAEKRGVVVQDGEVALEIDRMRSGMQNFAAMAARLGGEEGFARLVKEQMIIQRHLEDNVIGGETDPGRKQAALETWYRGLTEAHPVTIFDPALKGAVENSGGCGGSCCSKG